MDVRAKRTDDDFVLVHVRREAVFIVAPSVCSRQDLAAVRGAVIGGSMPRIELMEVGIMLFMVAVGMMETAARMENFDGRRTAGHRKDKRVIGRVDRCQ